MIKKISSKINEFGYTKIDFITYGNPTLDESKIINTDASFDHLIKRYSNYEFPNNSSQDAIKELQYLIKRSTVANNNEELLAEIMLIDKDLLGFLFKSFDDAKIVYEKKDVEEIITDISPLLLKLKYLHNRVRPYMLADWIGIDLFPRIAILQPSFPSNHCFKTKVICEYIRATNTDKEEEINTIIGKVSNSRFILGVSFPSDTFAAFKIADNLVADEVFFNKFQKIKKISDI